MVNYDVCIPESNCSGQVVRSRHRQLLKTFPNQLTRDCLAYRFHPKPIKLVRNEIEGHLCAYGVPIVHVLADNEPFPMVVLIEFAVAVITFVLIPDDKRCIRDRPIGPLEICLCYRCQALGS